MSGTRHTDDLLSIKTRGLALQNPDGSFPLQGSILAIADGIGTVATVKDISVSSVTVDTINVTGSLLQTNVLADQAVAATVNTSTMNVKYNMTVDDISTNSVVAAYITAADMSAGTIRAPNIYASTANVGTVLNTHYMSTSTAKMTDTTAPLVMGTKASIQNLTTSDLRTQTSTTQKNNIVDISASRGWITDISAVSAHGASFSASDTRSTTMAATNLTINDTLIVKNLAVSGILDISAINLDTLTTSDLCANIIRTGPINSRNANIGTLSTRAYDIRDISAGSYRVASVQTNMLNAVSLRPSEATVTVLSTGPAQFSSLNTPILSASTSITAGPTSTLVLSNSTSLSASAINLSGGLLTYTAPSSLLVNGLATTDVSYLYQQPFQNVAKNNNLATVADVSSTLGALTTSFNNLLGIFNQRGLIVSFLSQYTFNSSVRIQFKIGSLWKSPVVFPSGTRTDISGILNSLNMVEPTQLKFSAKSSLAAGWQTTITVTSGSTVAIGDVSGSTQSLQMLRYLGFNIDDATNPFQTYAYSGSSQSFVPTLLNLSGSYVSTGSISSFTNIANTLTTAPQYTFISATANSSSFKLSNPQGKYFYMNVSGSYILFPSVNTVQTIYNLAKSTTYQTNGYYLDNYNSSAVSAIVNLTTGALQPPINLTAATTFNSVTLSWSPFTGGMYSYRVDVTGYPVGYPAPPSTTVTGTSATISKLVQNTPYSFKVYTIDNGIASSVSSDIAATTSALTVPRPTILTNNPPANPPRTPNNTTAVISWIPRSDVSATLYYSISGTTKPVYNIPSGSSSYILPEVLSGTGDISGYFIYTDNSYNTVTGDISSTGYNSAFGGTYTGLSITGRPLGPNSFFGKIFASNIPNNNLWVGNTFRNVSLPIGISINQVPLTLTAYIYNIPPSVYYNVFKSSPTSINPFNLSQYAVTSAQVTFTITGNYTPTFTFTNAITITTSTVIMFTRSGTGNILIPTYQQTVAREPVTALSYNGTTLYPYLLDPNSLLLNNSVVICQFS